MTSFDTYFLDIARHVSTRSKDRSTKVGCVIVGPDNEIRSTGYNSFPRGINDDAPERHERPEKAYWVEHAERNAIYNAARVGTPLKGCRIFIPYFPCAHCARAIAQVGIVEVICTKIDRSISFSERWAAEHERAAVILQEASLAVRFVSQ